MNKPIQPSEPQKTLCFKKLIDTGYVSSSVRLNIADIIKEYGTDQLVISFDGCYDSSYNDYSYNLYQCIDEPNPDYDKQYSQYLEDLAKYKEDLKVYNKYLRDQKKIKKQQEIEQLEKRLKKLKGE